MSDCKCNHRKDYLEKALDILDNADRYGEAGRVGASNQLVAIALRNIIAYLLQPTPPTEAKP